MPMDPNAIFAIRTPIQFLFRSKNAEVYVKRDDRIFYSQGTKIRKLLGIYHAILPFWKNGKIRKVRIVGNLHSNAVLSGVLFFRYLGIPVRSLVYSRNPILVTPASQIAKRFSEISIFPTREVWKESINTGEVSERIGGSAAGLEFLPKTGELILPEYFFSSEALQGLNSLWEEIPEKEFDRVIIDIGSGLTWISAKDWGRTEVSGICIGLPREKMIPWFRENIPRLDRTFLSHLGDGMEDPRDLKGAAYGFGSKDNTWIFKSLEYYKRTGIYLEPIYAAKSLTAMEERIEKGEWGGKILYIYQGGSLMGSPTGIYSIE